MSATDLGSQARTSRVGPRSGARLTLLVVCGVAIALALIGGRVYFLSQRDAALERMNAELSAIRELKTDQIIQWRNGLLADGRQASQDPAVSDGIAAWLAAPGNAKTAANLRAWLDSIRRERGYERGLLLSVDGSAWLSTDDREGPDARDLAEARTALDGGVQTTITDLFLDPATGLPRLDVISLLGGGSTRTSAVLVLRGDPRDFLYPMIQSWPIPSGTAETLLVRRNGDDIVYLNELRHRSGTALKLTAPLSRVEVPAVMAATGRTGVVEGVDYRGHPVLAATGPIEGTAWYIVAKVDTAEAYADVFDRQRTTIVGVSLAILVVVLGFGLAWIQQANRYRRGQLESLTALDENRALLRSVVDSTTDAIYVKDLAGRYVLFNRGAELVTGKSADEVLGHDDALLFPAEEAKVVMDGDRAVIEGGVTRTYDEQVTGADGALHYFSSTKGPLCDTNGRPFALFGIAHDMTGRKRMEAELRDSEDKFKYVFDHSMVAKSLTLPSGEVQPNDAFCEMLGYTRDELTDRATWAQLTHPGDVVESQRHIDALISGGETSARWEKRYLRKDGGIVWSDVSTSLRRDAAGEPLYFMTTIVDITERKRVEAELRASVSRQQAILEAVPEIVAEVDADKVYVWLNEAGLAFFGDDVVGQEAVKYFLGEQETYARVAPLFEGAPETIYVESWQLRHDGEKRLLGWWCRGLTDEAGAPAGALSTARDITEQRAAEDELVERTEALARSNADLERFAYIASHDLQEPLRMVASYTQLLQTRYQGRLDSDADEFIGYAVDGAMRMQTLINDLLSFSRVGTQAAPLASSDLEDVLDGVLKVLQRSITETGATVTRDPMPVVMCDPTQIGQVFQNLIANAVKFRRDVPVTVRVSARETDNEWVFSVTDNGIGIEAQYFDRVFVIFQRLEPRADFPGTGIGLAVSKRIIERHCGRIWVESEPGIGSTFHFTLPT
jgi:PAS domain S-box-containing protein